MSSCHAAIYARVSSEHQAEGGTVASQIAALEARLAQDGLQVTPDHRFVDDGYSGSTLKRPALERLRDAVASGLVDESTRNRGRCSGGKAACVLSYSEDPGDTASRLPAFTGPAYPTSHSF